MVEELHLTEDRPFHRALDDAYYTGRVMSEMDFYSMMEYVSVDYYQPPLTRGGRSTWNFRICEICVA